MADTNVRSIELPVEYFSIVFQIFGILAPFVVAGLKILTFLKGPSSLKIYPCLITTCFGIIQIFVTLNGIVITSPRAWGASGGALLVVVFCYVEYQIFVLEQIIGRFIHRKWIMPLFKILSGIIFMVFAGTHVFRFNLFDPDSQYTPGVVLMLDNLNIVWFAYALIVDVAVNATLIKILISNSFLQKSKTTSDGNSRKRALALSVCVILFDILAVALYGSILFSNWETDTVVRTNIAIQGICSAFASGHIAFGVYCLNFVLAKPRRATPGASSNKPATTPKAPVDFQTNVKTDEDESKA